MKRNITTLARLTCALYTIWLVLGAATNVHAQTLFTILEKPVNIERYSTPHECMALYSRIVADSNRNASKRDTLVYDFGNEEIVPPENAVSGLRQCLSKFSLESIGEDQLTSVWLRALAHARMFDEARIIARHNAESADTNHSSESLRKLSVLRNLIFLFQRVSPLPVEQLKDLESEVRTLITDMSDSVNLEWESILLSMWNGIAIATGDTHMLARNARNLLANRGMIERYRTSSLGRMMIFNSMATADMGELMDSLRNGMSSYMALRQSHWEFASGSAEDMPVPYGLQAPPLVGEFWYQRDNEAGLIERIAVDSNGEPHKILSQRPLAGRNNLVIFFKGCRQDKAMVQQTGQRYTGANQPCDELYFVIRRLKQAYPDLEITLVIQTIGYFGHSSPLEPSEEADIISKWLLDYHQLPVTVVVNSTPYFRLQSPDGRRIDQTDRNRENYSFNGLLGSEITPEVYSFLLDSDSRVVYYGVIGRKIEHILTEFLEAMKAD